MQHNEFFAALKAGKIEKLYLFEGEEEFTKRSALKTLRAMVADGDFAAMNDATLKDPAPDELISAAETLPFLADRRFLLIRECAMLSGTKAKNYDEEAAIKRLTDYFEHLPDTTCMVFYVDGKADGRRKLYNLIKKKGMIVQFSPLDDTQLNKWIAKQLAQGGRKITAADCQQLWFTVGRDLNLLGCEIDKLIAYTEGRDVVNSDDIQEICSKSQEYKVFDMSTALLDGNGKKAFLLMQDILRNGEDRLFLLSLLGAQCRRLYYAQAMKKAGAMEGEVAGKLGIPPFAARNTLRQASQFSMQELRMMCDWCIDTEFKVKNGEMSDEGSLEDVMLRVLTLLKEKKK